ncbi:FecR family protein [Chitinophaga sp. XS-30]|uniref:FecR family protein n=1 Tax=Chitinophaga sp. XS-30 TaxID=2604421 RepID=UPI0011DE3F67|nr:FecR family protein [Chitinophaga sp. XS-30]QEH39402.1 DUF4974 domain-containing protein [Chitinophaga sp. XS-30]
MNFFQQIFRRYQQHNSGQQEKELVDRWYDATGNTPRPDWMSAEHTRQLKESTWQRITANLGLETTTTRARGMRRIPPIVKYAAAAAITGLGIWGIMQYFSQTSRQHTQHSVFTTYTAKPGTQKHITLPDGTEIWLNNGSSLRVKSPSTPDTSREVWLTEGEAYFQVAKDRNRPFIVHVDALTTRVLGTAFNIQAYRELSKLQVSVTAGQVQVGYHQNVLDTLTRNMQLDYHPASGEFSVVHKEMPGKSSWRDGRFVLDRADFSELALRLRLRYGLLLISENERIRHTAFSAGFQPDASLQSVLETLCTLYNTRYTIKKDTLIIH